MNHIELFAGCGGLSLGLKSQGYDLLFANELSPMAGETFAFNFFNEDLDTLSGQGDDLGRLHTKWLSSQYERTQLKRRLRENPQDYPSLSNGHCDILNETDFRKSLIVGSIVQLNRWLESHPQALARIRSGLGHGEVDLVSGGPPCQSFSMSGLREFSNARNVLPWEFAKFVSAVRPRFALLENVTGILRPFTVNGEQRHAWIEVASAFAQSDYIPLCLHINAKYVGVAQNRPRFLMVLMRADVFDDVFSACSEMEKSLLAPSIDFCRVVKANRKLTPDSLPCFDVEDTQDFKYYRHSFLRPLISKFGRESSVEEAIGDLVRVNAQKTVVPSPYLKRLRQELGPHLPQRNSLENVELRKHTDKVIRRFVIYQNLSKIGAVDRSACMEALDILQGEAEFLTREAFEVLREFDYQKQNGVRARFLRKRDLEKHLLEHATKKQTQRSLVAGLPAPAALSIPDDACHYAIPRTLSVREMARIQSFPDNFEFRSKATTGGQNRKYEVPQYTQVGNAVPPLLGVAIGRLFRHLDAKALRGRASRQATQAHVEKSAA